MQNSPSGPAWPTSGRCLRARSQALRRASLLIGTSFLLHAAPARAANECGPPPPGGGAVTCPAGEYPNGIDYVAGNLDILLQPGVVTRDTSTIQSSGNVRVIGPVQTSLNALSSTAVENPALSIRANGSAFAQIDSLTTSGIFSAGLFIFSQSGDVRAEVGTVATSGAISRGVDAFGGLGSRNISVQAGSVTTTGRDAAGLLVVGHTLDVTAGTVVTRGQDSVGIDVGGTRTFLVNATRIETSGDRSPAVRARSDTADVTINAQSVSTTGTASHGIFVETGGTVIVSAGSISVTGQLADAILVTAPRAISINVSGLVQSAQGLAVRASGGPAIVNILAGGTLRGRIGLTAGADRVNNAGTFDAIGSSDFGPGADLFDNGPAATVRAINGGAVFTGLESFANRGLIDLRDGAVGDSIALQGAYVGTGGARVGVDVDFEAGVADRLITGAATGSTLIELQGVAGGGRFGSGILLVDAGAGTSPAAFALAAGSETPYLRARLRFDPAGNDFLLDRLPGAAVFETARLGSMAARLWYESADAVAAQLDSVRDGRGRRGIGLWLQGWSGEHERAGTQFFAATAETFDVSYDQDFQGLQGGLDFQTGAVAVGLTAGVARSDATFTATGNPVDMEVGNIGAYVQGRSGVAFFNALAKFDRAEMEIAPGAGLGAGFDADSFGIQANAGVRLGFGSVFAEPSVGLSWVNWEVEAFASGPATVGPGRGESLRARAGLRVGARLALGGGALLPFVAADAYEELGGRNRSDFTLGETLRLLEETPGTRGRAAAGATFVAGSFEAFVRGEMDFGGKGDTKSVRAGARLRF